MRENTAQIWHDHAVMLRHRRVARLFFSCDRSDTLRSCPLASLVDG